jgi:hypothetical protein
MTRLVSDSIPHRICAGALAEAGDGGSAATEVASVWTGVSGDLGAGAQPLDLDMSRNGNFLFVIKNGTGMVGAFAVAGDGSLTPLADTPGLAARAGYMGLAAY